MHPFPNPNNGFLPIDPVPLSANEGTAFHSIATRHSGTLNSVTHVFRNATVIEVDIGFGRYYRFFSDNGGLSYVPLLVNDTGSLDVFTTPIALRRQTPSPLIEDPPPFALDEDGDGPFLCKALNDFEVYLPFITAHAAAA